MRFKKKKNKKHSEEGLIRLSELFSLDFWESDIREILPNFHFQGKKKISNPIAIKYEIDELPKDIKEFDIEWKDNVSELDINAIIENWNQFLENDQQNKEEKKDI